MTVSVGVCVTKSLILITGFLITLCMSKISKTLQKFKTKYFGCFLSLKVGSNALVFGEKFYQHLPDFGI